MCRVFLEVIHFEKKKLALSFAWVAIFVLTANEQAVLHPHGSHIAFFDFFLNLFLYAFSLVPIVCLPNVCLWFHTVCV